MDWQKIDAQLDGLPPPPRAYALALAAYEAAGEASKAEQIRETVNVCADDPEPPDPFHCGSDLTLFHARYGAHSAWYERNKDRLHVMAERVIAKHHVRELKRLHEAAEKNLVQWAKERCQAVYGHRFALASQAWDAYEAGELYGDMREKFLKLCFNAPEPRAPIRHALA